MNVWIGADQAMKGPTFLLTIISCAGFLLVAGVSDKGVSAETPPFVAALPISTMHISVGEGRMDDLRQLLSDFGERNQFATSLRFPAPNSFVVDMRRDDYWISAIKTFAETDSMGVAIYRSAGGEPSDISTPDIFYALKAAIETIPGVSVRIKVRRQQ